MKFRLTNYKELARRFRMWKLARMERRC